VVVPHECGETVASVALDKQVHPVVWAAGVYNWLL